MLTTISLCLLLAPSQSPQDPTRISPAAAVVQLGGGGNNAPFSVIPTHYQQVHDRETFNSQMPGLLTRMRLRMGSGFANRPGATVDVELHLAHSPNQAAIMSTTFANNIVPGTEVNVLTRKMVSLPQVPDNAWAIPFPFDVPFVFIGSAHLGWRAVVFGNSNNNSSFTYPLDVFSATTPGTSFPNGPATGCRSASGAADAVHQATIGVLGGQATFRGDSHVAVGGLPAILTLGSNPGSFAGVPLPFDLGLLGAPGCSIRNDIAVTLAGTTQSGPTGSVTLNLGIPPSPGLEGAMLHTQFIFLEPAANRFGLFTTNGLTHRFPGPLGISRMYDRGNPLGTTATITGLQYGLAVGFD